jgi:exonuclease III
MRTKMLEEFLHKQEIDILLLQEVTQHDFDVIRGYNAYINVRIYWRGTAMPTTEQISLTNITRLPQGGGTAPSYRGFWLVNIYAPSGSAKREERESFYNVERTYLLRSLPQL